jgi:hypothetical protein
VTRQRARHTLRVGALLLLVACTSRRGRRAIEPALPEYTLNVRLRPTEREIDVAGTLRLPASDKTREELRVSLSERINELHVEVLEPSVSAGLATVERAAQTTPRVEGERGDSKWIIRPRHAIPEGHAVRLRFSSKGNGKAALLFYVGPEVAFGSGWGDTWYPVVEGTGGKATGELTIEVPPKWRVITGAARRSTADEEARGTFRFLQSLPTHFTFSAGPYSIVRHAGATPVTAWLLSPRKNIDGRSSGRTPSAS